jgi:predicted nuclease of predicted toxin-antitoxin system
VKFLADENFPLQSARLLSAAGHDVATVVLESPGAGDEQLLERAAREGRVLLTFDRDFGYLIFRRGVPAPVAVVYFRFVPRSPAEPAEYLLALLGRIASSLPGTLVVAERDRARQRPLPEAGGP